VTKWSRRRSSARTNGVNLSALLTFESSMLESTMCCAIGSFAIDRTGARDPLQTLL